VNRRSHDLQERTKTVSSFIGHLGALIKSVSFYKFSICSILLTLERGRCFNSQTSKFKLTHCQELIPLAGGEGAGLYSVGLAGMRLVETKASWVRRNLLGTSNAAPSAARAKRRASVGMTISFRCDWDDNFLFTPLRPKEGLNGPPDE
jgi:hypothetical protein